MDKRGFFELLSAYLDGEVTATERKQVEEWLSTDTDIKSLYKRLLTLRQSLQNLPIPTGVQSPETTLNIILARLRFRYRLNWMLGGAVTAVCIIGAMSSLFPNSSRMLEFARTQPTESTATEPVVAKFSIMIALNNPVFEIPKTAISPDEQPVNKLD